MSGKLLQLNFNFSISRAEYEQTASSLATEFANVDGLRWKIWLMNEGGSEAGGIYLFDDESSLQAFLAGPLAAQVQSHLVAGVPRGTASSAGPESPRLQ
jgi:hypothetical protein